MEKKITSVSREFAGQTLTFETGLLAPQATAAVLARLGDTVVLATVVAGGIRDGIDYFPLSVEYAEKLYAGGRIKGSRWVKRDGRPTDEAVLTGRLIDRSIRPLFPKEYKNEVQVVVTLLSVDGENSADVLAINAVSAAIAMSRVPWSGPIAAIRMGYMNEAEGKAAEYLPNPTISQQDESALDIVVSQSKDLTLMIESGANQVPEDVMVESIKKAHSETAVVLEMIEELVKKVGQKKDAVPQNSALTDAVKFVEKGYSSELQGLIDTRANKEGSGSETEDLIKKIYNDYKMANPEGDLDSKMFGNAVEYLMFKLIKSNVVTKKKRPDGRKIDEIREITTGVSILPRTHGSALFNRGLTQALSIVTLGSPRMEQLLEAPEGESTKRYIHHYSGPPYSFGQAGRFGFVSRREIGHGALAERALLPVIPSQADFPYTIRVVSEVLSQNGSSSMASTCGSTLALMDAGVPITKPVAGISIGRMSVDDKSVLLTDIIGLEDFSGDMDFKVAGTDTGVTAIQLDVKIPGLTVEEIAEIFERARTARLEILKTMMATIPESRKALSEYAPKIETLQIPVDKIGELIGPGGKVIKNIIAQTGATVDVEDDGVVTISGVDQEAVTKAMDWVSGMMREVVVGEQFTGTVKRILNFGAFVEFLPGKEGMVHVSKMARDFVNNPEDVVQLGQEVEVKVLEIDDQGRINLTMLLDDDGSQGPREPRAGGSGPRSGSGSSHGGGERRPYQERRPYGNRDAGTSDRGNHDGGDRGGMRSTNPHPLAQQFRRDRSEQRTPGRPDQRRKAHY
jgi:polyribonucleotide nucleotidyltransferase